MEKKKGNRLIAILVFVLLMVVSLGNSLFYNNSEKAENPSIETLNSNDSFIDDLFINNMLQYNELASLDEKATVNYRSIFLDTRYQNTNIGYEFDNIMERLEEDYSFYNMGDDVVDRFAESGNQRTFSLDLSNLKKDIDAHKFAWYLIMNYDQDGKLTYQNASQEFIDHASSKYFKGSLMNYQNYNFEPIIQNKVLDNGSKIAIEPIKNATFIYAITVENFEALQNNERYFRYYDTNYNSNANSELFSLLCSSIVVIICMVTGIRHMKTIKFYRTILSIPFEILVCLLTFIIPWLCVISIEFTARWISSSVIIEIMPTIAITDAQMIDFAISSVLFFLYSVSLSMAVYAIKNIFDEGFKNYLNNFTLTGKVVKKVKKTMDVFKDFSFGEVGNRKIMLAVLINLVIGCIASSFFAFGYLVLIVYSVGLLLYLMRVFKRIQLNYNQLEELTNELSKGNLDVEVNEDMGIFNHVKDNLLDVKNGFKNAVEEEVKSQRMKTELISNVSHDLKTPLTTLISYIDLLQHDDLTEEERKRYITILDGSSMRLKRCIEDLFEISKVESGNVSCNLVKVNLVDLMKQTHFELSDKIEKSTLIFKVKYPTEKVSCLLDSSKTYRVFENLYINILKYALPNSRVFIELIEDEEFAYISFKNISAKEITYLGSELTERFVRNDASRNSDGSGLGLAIAKSFTELMNGKFNVEVEGDYFKVFIKFKKNNDAYENNEPIQVIDKENIMAEIVEESENCSEIVESSDEVIDDETKEGN